MTYKVGPKGQVVLPKVLRDELGIRPGDEVEVVRRDDEIIVRPAIGSAAALRGLLKQPGGRPLTDDLLAARRRDRDREERKYQQWSESS